MLKSLMNRLLGRLPPGSIINKTGSLVGQTTDGRRVVVARGLPGGFWQEDQLREIAAELLADPGRGLVVAIDEETASRWSGLDPDGLCKLTDQLYTISMRSPHNVVWAMHPPGEARPDLDPALVYLLRSSGFEVESMEMTGP